MSNITKANITIRGITKEVEIYDNGSPSGILVAGNGLHYRFKTGNKAHFSNTVCKDVKTGEWYAPTQLNIRRTTIALVGWWTEKASQPIAAQW